MENVVQRKPKNNPVTIGRATDAGQLLPAPRDPRVWCLFHVTICPGRLPRYWQVMRDRSTRLWWIREGCWVFEEWTEQPRIAIPHEVGRQIWDRLSRNRSRREIIIPYRTDEPPEIAFAVDLQDRRAVLAAREPQVTLDSLQQYVSGQEYEVPYNSWFYQQVMAVCREQNWTFRASRLALDKSQTFKFRIFR
jgi:hypothetical protein